MVTEFAKVSRLKNGRTIAFLTNALLMVRDILIKNAYKTVPDRINWLLYFSHKNYFYVLKIIIKIGDGNNKNN